jgi:glycerophosphoryl diester phosphodiesterase
MNSLWPQHNASNDDEKAVNNFAVYDWFINRDIDIIQTDRSKSLLKNLRNKRLPKKKNTLHLNSFI